jgi:hypothetical protein
MRSILSLSAAALLVACSTSPALKSNAPDRAGIRSEFGTASLQEGVYHCVSPGHSNPNKYPKCHDGIPVIVLLKEASDGCLALVPYRTLMIHTNRDKTKVVWKLFGPDRYEFDLAKGIELRRKQNPTDPTLPDAIFEGGGREANGTFSWTIRLGAPEKKEFEHDARVLDPKNPGEHCERIDPLITNVDN